MAIRSIGTRAARRVDEHLGYCSCAYGTALPFVRDFLRLVVDRTDGVKNTERFWRASEGLVELLQGDGSPAMRSWFVYTLDKADLIMHGFNLYDVLIMDRWRWLLDGLERFPGPPPGENAEAEPLKSVGLRPLPPLERLSEGGSLNTSHDPSIGRTVRFAGRFLEGPSHLPDPIPWTPSQTNYPHCKSNGVEPKRPHKITETPRRTMTFTDIP